MKSGKKFAIIGGDLRQVDMAEKISADGHQVRSYGLLDVGRPLRGVTACDTLENALAGSDIVVLPLPAAKGDQMINLSDGQVQVEMQRLFKAMEKHQIVLGGKFEEKSIKLAEAYCVHLIDYFKREELNVLNAVPTAEGVLQLAMEELPITLHNSKVLVIGYGRIGKLTANIFKGVGANVTVCARKHSDIAWIKSYGYTPVYLEHFQEGFGTYDLIVNTVPHLLLDEEALTRVRDDCLVIDVASKPGGVDFQKAQELGKKVIWALSLPGKVAPLTAGEIVKSTIYNILDELGV